MSLALAPDMVGVLHYTLHDEGGDLLESSRGGNPMAYLHGHRNLVPGLEAALEGKAAGDRVDVTVSPEQAYGERRDVPPQQVHRREFPKDFDLFEGRQIVVEGPDGNPMPLWISKVQGAQVWIDINHPLAGQTLRFDVEVIDVRAASPEELAHGHVHGAGGHHH